MFLLNLATPGRRFSQERGDAGDCGKDRPGRIKFRTREPVREKTWFPQDRHLIFEALANLGQWLKTETATQEPHSQRVSAKGANLFGRNNFNFLVFELWVYRVGLWCNLTSLIKWITSRQIATYNCDRGEAPTSFLEVRTASNHLRTAKELPKPRLRLLYAMLGELPIASDAGK